MRRKNRNEGNGARIRVYYPSLALYGRAGAGNIVERCGVVAERRLGEGAAGLRK